MYQIWKSQQLWMITLRYTRSSGKRPKPSAWLASTFFIWPGSSFHPPPPVSYVGTLLWFWEVLEHPRLSQILSHFLDHFPLTHFINVNSSLRKHHKHCLLWKFPGLLMPPELYYITVICLTLLVLYFLGNALASEI